MFFFTDVINIYGNLLAGRGTKVKKKCIDDCCLLYLLKHDYTPTHVRLCMSVCMSVCVCVRSIKISVLFYLIVHDRCFMFSAIITSEFCLFSLLGICEFFIDFYLV